MNRENIKKARELYIANKNLDLKSFKNKLVENSFIVSYGTYSKSELAKALKEGRPIIINQKKKLEFIAGHNGKSFLNDESNVINLEKSLSINAIMIDAVSNLPERARQKFVIIGKNKWNDIVEFQRIFSNLEIGDPLLPPHSAIFNFLEPSEEYKQKKNSIGIVRRKHKHIRRRKLCRQCNPRNRSFIFQRLCKP